MAPARTNRSPALFASALGHVLVIASALIAWPFLMKPAELGKVVPVTLVTNGPPADLKAAEKAPEPLPALAPAPTPQAPPQPAPISSAPPTPPAAPAPSKASSAAKAAPIKANAKPDSINWDKLLAEISSTPARPTTQQTSGQPGQVQRRTAPVAQQGQGEDERMSANEVQALGDKLGKLWNPNCQVLGANDTNIKVQIQFTSQGWVVKKQLVNEAEIRASNNPVLVAAADRAMSAIGRGEPYSDVLNPAHYSSWRVLVVNFNAKQVCSKQ